MPSFVWKYFTREGRDGARCKEKLCEKYFEARATTSLIYHLKKAHDINEVSNERRGKKRSRSCADKGVWSYATKIEDESGELFGRCSLCGKLIKCSKRSTSSLQKHLNTHGIEVSQVKNKPDDWKNLSFTSNKPGTLQKVPSHKPASTCYICKTSLTTDKAQLSFTFKVSQTSIHQILESFTGSEITEATKNRSAVCLDCFTNLQKYDDFQYQSQSIQNEITNQLKCNNGEKVFIKEEPQDDLMCEASIFTSFLSDTMKDTQLKPSKCKRLAYNKVGPYECDTCGVKVKFRSSLVNHLKNHLTISKKFSCSDCPKNFRHEYQLNCHMMTGHDLKEGPLECPLCFETAQDRTKFKSHYNSHFSEPKHLCTQCGKSFSHDESYKMHMMYHDDIRPFACDFDGCDKKFRTATQRKIHFWVHTGEKNFECHLCPGRKFAQKWGRDLHMKKHHKNESILKEICKVCGIKVEKGNKMKLHLTHVHQVHDSNDYNQC